MSILRYILTISMVLTLSLLAQPVKINVSYTRDTLQIGDTLHIKFDVEQEPSLNPRLKSWGNMQVADVEIYDSVLTRQNDRHYSIAYTVACFDTGRIALSPFRVSVKQMGTDTSSTTYGTDSIWLYVQSVVPDSATDILNIAEPISLPFPWLKLIAFLLAVILLIVMAAFIKKWVRIRDKPLHEVETLKKPAHEIAYERLNRLKPESLRTHGDIKRYYFTVSSILREYLENRFEKKYLEMTSFEIKNILKKDIEDFEIQKKVLDILTVCDRVKFAKYIPEDSMHKTVLRQVYSIIENTFLKLDKKVETEEKEETQ